MHNIHNFINFILKANDLHIQYIFIYIAKILVSKWRSSRYILKQEYILLDGHLFLI